MARPFEGRKLLVGQGSVHRSSKASFSLEPRDKARAPNLIGVVGYGLDHAGLSRNLGYIGVL